MIKSNNSLESKEDIKTRVHNLENFFKKKMLRSVSGHLFNRLAKLLKQDTEKIVEQSIVNNLPTKRGEFNPYQVFDFFCRCFFFVRFLCATCSYKMEHLWTKYFDGSLNRADLSWWEKIDMQLILHWRSSMRYQRMGLYD